MPEGVQDYELNRNVYYRVQWKNKTKGATTVTDLVRRTIESAVELAEAQKKRGFKVHLFRVEETEIEV